MGSINIKGLDEFGLYIDTLGAKADGIMKMGVYDGARVVYDEVKKSIEALPTSDNNSKHRDITPEQKKGLLDSLYGSQIMQDKNKTYEYIGFTGYNDVQTKKYPKGQPNILIARSVESGASYMNKNPFMRKALNTSKKRATDAVAQTIKKEIAKIK